MFLYQDQICLQNIQSAARDIFVKSRESYIRLSFPIHMFIYTLKSLWKVDELLTFFYHLFSRFGEHDILVYLGVTDSAELGQFIITWWVLISNWTIWFRWENLEFPKYKHLLNFSFKELPWHSFFPLPLIIITQMNNKEMKKFVLKHI